MKEKHHKKDKEPEAEPIEDVEERNDEELTDREFVASVIRAPRQGTYEQYFCQLLAQSVICTDPLKRVKIVTEAAWTIKEPERKNLAIDYEIVSVLNAIANALLNPSSQKCDLTEIVSIPWGFDLTEENWNKFIRPWMQGSANYYPVFLSYKHVVLKKPVYTNCWPEVVKIIYEPYWEWSFESSRCLSVQGFNTLRNAFIAWASPQAQNYLAELTSVVDPNTYRDVLGLYSKPGRRDYAQKVKETTQLTAGTQNEDSVD
jgi:hypothetical protein